MYKKFILALSFIFAFQGILCAEPIKQNLESVVSVSSQVIREYQPDTAKLRFYVVNQGLNVKDLKEKNDKIVNLAISEINKSLTNGESIKTIDFSINSIYSYKDKVKLFQKYEVTNGFEVKLKDINKVSNIIEIATNNGVKSVDNIQFYIEDTKSICNKLLSEVSKDAKERASIVAESLGMTLYKIKSATPYCQSSTSPRYINRMTAFDKSVMYENSAVQQSIQVGNISVTSSINLVYYLK